MGGTKKGDDTLIPVCASWIKAVPFLAGFFAMTGQVRQCRNPLA
jgi:hypothetical protein